MSLQSYVCIVFLGVLLNTVHIGSGDFKVGSYFDNLVYTSYIFCVNTIFFVNFVPKFNTHLGWKEVNFLRFMQEMYANKIYITDCDKLLHY